MSDKSADRPAKADASAEAPLPEIEVTPEMLEACDREGLLADYGFPLHFDRHAEMAKIYRVMVKAKAKGSVV
jgi:hypothetical protein